MPYFSFSEPIKKPRAKTSGKPKGLWTIQERNVKAVVDITENLDYVAILYDGRKITIHKDCYDCKGHNTIYSQLLYGEYKQRCLIERIPADTTQHFPYLPFCVGAVIVGNIVFRNDNLNTYFKIKKCYLDYEDEFAVRITKAFKEVWNDDLKHRIINNYINLFKYD